MLSYLCEKELIEHAKIEINDEQLQLAKTIEMSPTGIAILELLSCAQKTQVTEEETERGIERE